jgi:PadR family transcriptional regulator, regulatory protein PadR
MRNTRAVRAVFTVLLSAPEHEHYGLAITEAAKLRPGTVYPIMARLQDDGCVTSRWEHGSPTVRHRPRRKAYRLTNTGIQTGRTFLAAYTATYAPAPGTVQLQRPVYGDDDIARRLVGELARRRLVHGMSLADLARRTGTNEQTIGRVERGETEPRLSTTARWGRALGLRLMWVPDER